MTSLWYLGDIHKHYETVVHLGHPVPWFLHWSNRSNMPALTPKARETVNGAGHTVLVRW